MHLISLHVKFWILVQLLSDLASLQMRLVRHLWLTAWNVCQNTHRTCIDRSYHSRSYYWTQCLSISLELLSLPQVCMHVSIIHIYKHSSRIPYSKRIHIAQSMKSFAMVFLTSVSSRKVILWTWMWPCITMASMVTWMKPTALARSMKRVKNSSKLLVNAWKRQLLLLNLASNTVILEKWSRAMLLPMDFQSFVHSVDTASTSSSTVHLMCLIMPVSISLLISQEWMDDEPTCLIDNKAIGVLRPGHVFTIEPMICEGTWRDEIW